jgi:hypothetical protein
MYGSGGGGQSASVVGMTISGYGAPDKTLVLPSGTLPGDQLIAVFTQLTSDGTWTVPTGFTYIQDYRAGSGGEMRNLYWTGLAGSVGSPLTFSLDNGRNTQGVLVAVRGGLVGPSPIWSGGTGPANDVDVQMPNSPAQFVVVHNWDGMPGPGLPGTPPASFDPLAGPTGIMVGGLLPGPGGLWTGLNSGSGYAHSLAFDVVPT